MLKILAILVFTISFTFSSFADVIFEMDQSQVDPEATHKTKGMVKGNNFKMEFYENGEKLDGAMIYHGDKKEMIMVNHQDKSYVVLDKATMNELAGVMAEAMSQFEEAMKDASPEERAMMEKMMKGRMPGAGESQTVEPVIKKAGSGKVNNYSCTNYDVYRGDVKTSQHCVASWESLEGGAEMKTVMVEMSQFMDQLSKSFKNSKGMFGQQMKFENNVFKQIEKMNGFPVQSIDYGNGVVISESELVSSKKTTVNASDLEPPAGYKKQRMDLN
ncbi:MAG: hypothetical protein DHS20C13_10610 [Thermodesulfobacteriota bacterium]|nr:MAG: hypothetical protein DHS20C13_10610 [Thermodesulfobacteriota bacterium]